MKPQTQVGSGERRQEDEVGHETGTKLWPEEPKDRDGKREKDTGICWERVGLYSSHWKCRWPHPTGLLTLITSTQQHWLLFGPCHPRMCCQRFASTLPPVQCMVASSLWLAKIWGIRSKCKLYKSRNYCFPYNSSMPWAGHSLAWNRYPILVLQISLRVGKLHFCLGWMTSVSLNR